MVKPLLYKLSEVTLKFSDSDTATVKQVKTAIKNDLDQRYQTAALQRLMNVATYPDPRYKELPFLTVIKKRLMIDQVEDELMDMQPLEKVKKQERRVENQNHQRKSRRKALSPNSLEICLSHKRSQAVTRMT